MVIAELIEQPTRCPVARITGVCPTGTSITGPVLLYLQQAGVGGITAEQAGTQAIRQDEPAVFLQDKWQPRRNLTIQFGLRWEAQIFPKMVIAPSAALYGQYLSDPRFPSTGYLPNQTKEFQPRFGFVFDLLGNGKSSLRGSAGIFNARQNGLTEVGAITTNGVRIRTLTGSTTNSEIRERWDLLDEHGKRFTDGWFNSVFHLTLPDSGRTQTLRGP